MPLDKLFNAVDSQLHLHAHVEVILKQIFANFLGTVPEHLSFKRLSNTSEVTTDLRQISFDLLECLHRQIVVFLDQFDELVFRQRSLLYQIVRLLFTFSVCFLKVTVLKPRIEDFFGCVPHLEAFHVVMRWIFESAARRHQEQAWIFQVGVDCEASFELRCLMREVGHVQHLRWRRLVF